MQEQIRFYIGSSFRIYTLKHGQELKFGTGVGCDIQLPRHAAEVNGRIFLTADGLMLDNGKQRRALKQGEFIPLNRENRIAVEFLCNDGQKRQLTLSEAVEWRIGRDAETDISLANSRVSTSHAKLYFYNGEWHICDLNSTNGSFLNGKQIGDAALREADEIAIGPYTLVYYSDTLLISGGSVKLKTQVHIEKKRHTGGDFNRSPRVMRSIPEGEVEIDAAPSMGGKPEINWLTMLMPTMGTLVVSGVMMAVTGSVGMMMSAPMMLIGVATTAISYRSQTKKFTANNTAFRQKYQAYLDEKESQIREAARLQKDAACFSNPTPAQCVSMALRGDSRLFERTAKDRDFLSIRIGVGEEKLRLQVRTPKIGFALQEDEMTAAPAKLAEKYASIQDMPVVCDLLHAPVVGIVGEQTLAQRVAQAMLVQLCALHGSDEVRIAVVFSEQEQGRWMWTRWLPQIWNEDRSKRYIACGRYEAEEMFRELDGELKRRVALEQKYGENRQNLPHWVFLLADLSIVPAQTMEYLTRGLLGVSCIALGAGMRMLPAGVQQIIELGGVNGAIYDRNDPSTKQYFAADQVSLSDCDAFARALAPIRLRQSSETAALPQMITLLEGYHAVDPAEIEIGEFWAHACSWKSLSVPIGRGTDGNYYFDIHEKHGGPHGLVAGSNGSGKSEMAQSWIASMALQFSPRDVNFVLVDFKGTSLLAPLKNLPHLAGSISNLDRDVHRCLQALDYEIERRQRLVDRWNVHDILEYQARSARDPAMEPMPFLILVIDEFADFKAQFPDFTGALEHIFRGGRSLGVYTLIMTQKPAGVVTEQMYANARFRWCLKVMSEADSREMLGVNSAAQIDTPGRCYIKTDAGRIDAVQPFYAGAPYESADEKNGELPVAAKVLRNGMRQSATDTEKTGAHGTQLEAVVQAIAHHCRIHHVEGARKLWLPPLEDRIELAELLPQGRFWQSAQEWQSSDKHVCALIGMMDDPSRQEQRVLEHDFINDGNLLVYGMPLSGKSTLLSSMAISLCNAYAPDQLQIYLMDFGGYALRSMESFPHVRGVGGDDEPEVLEKIVHAFKDEIRRRKQLFRSCGVGTYAAYRQGDELPAWVLLIDNLSLCCGEFYELTEELIRISREGEAFGLYLACATTGTMGLNYTLSQNFSRVLCLQLNDASDYTAIVGRTPQGMPRKTIGRGLVSGPREFQTAIAFAEAGDRERAAKIRALSGRMQQAWHGDLPAKIAPLPTHVPYDAALGEPIVWGLETKDGQTARMLLSENVGCLVSASDRRQKERVKRLLMQQICEYADAVGITNVCNAMNMQIATEPQQMLNKLCEVATELRRRQSARKAGSKEKFQPIVIVIDDLAAMLEGGSDELTSRLEVFVRLGAGLNVTVIVLDLAENLEKMYFGGNILMETMRDQNMLLAGGSAQVHRIADGKLYSQQAKGVLEQDDWIWIQGDHWSAIRPMESED